MNEPIDARIDKIVQDFWQGSSANLESRPGEYIEQLVNDSMQRNMLHESPELRAWLIVYDDCLLWSTSLSKALVETMMAKKEGVLPPLFTACMLLSSAITSHLFSIRLLVLSGFDVQAKQIARSLSEHVDTLLLLILHPELADEFSLTEDRDRANEFWNKHLRRGKARKALHAEIERIIGDVGEEFSKLKVWRQEEENALSMASHPTKLGCYVGMCVPVQEGSEYTAGDEPVSVLGFLGVRHSQSVRTLQYACFVLSYLFAFASFPFGEEGPVGFPTPIKFDPDNFMHTLVKHGRVVSMLSILMLNGLMKKEGERQDVVRSEVQPQPLC